MDIQGQVHQGQRPTGQCQERGDPATKTVYGLARTETSGETWETDVAWGHYGSRSQAGEATLTGEVVGSSDFTNYRLKGHRSGGPDSHGCHL